MNCTDPIASSPKAGQSRRGLLVALGAVASLPFFAGCAAPVPGAAQPTGEGREEPGFAEPPQGTQRRVALVLSGGGASGFAHQDCDGVYRPWAILRWSQRISSTDPWRADCRRTNQRAIVGTTTH